MIKLGKYLEFSCSHYINLLLKWTIYFTFDWTTPFSTIMHSPYLYAIQHCCKKYFLNQPEVNPQITNS